MAKLHGTANFRFSQIIDPLGIVEINVGGGYPMSKSEIISFISLTVALCAFATAVLRNRWMAKQLRLSSAISIIKWLEDVRPDRQRLYKLREEGREFRDWSSDERDAAYRLTRWFDILGLLDSLGYVDQRLVDRFYAVPAREIWDICAGWIKDEQSRRGAQHLWEFQKFADRVRHVKDNHPAHRKIKDWPRNPRKEWKA
jgi:hypothetical protein